MSISTIYIVVVIVALLCSDTTAMLHLHSASFFHGYIRVDLTSSLPWLGPAHISVTGGGSVK